MDNATESASEDRRILPALYLLLLVFVGTSLEYGISGPMLPLYIIGLGASVSVMSACFAAMDMVSTVVRIPVGVLSDRYGSRIFLVGGVILSILALLISTISQTWQQLLVAMIFSGLAGGLFYTVQQKAIALTADVKGRSRAFALSSLMWSLIGFSTPVAAGYLVEHHGLRSPFIVGLFASLLGLPLSLRIKIGDSDKANPHIAMQGRYTKLGDDLPVMANLGLAQLILTIARAVPWTLTAIYLKMRFGCTYSEVGYYLAMMSLGGIVATPVAARLGTPRARRGSILILMPVMGFIFIGLALSRSALSMTVLMFFMNMLGLICGTSIDALAADAAPKGRLGMAYGVSSTTIRLGYAVGSFLGGYFADFFGFEIAFFMGAGFSFLSIVPAFTLGRFLPSPRSTGSCQHEVHFDP